MLFRELRRRTFGKLVIDGLALVKRRDVHLEIAPFVALLFRVQERAVHEPLENRPVAIHKLHLAEGGQKQVALHLLDLFHTGYILADDVIRHQRDAVVVAARAVVKIFRAAEIGAPVGKKGRVLLLHPRPDRFLLTFGIVQRNFALNLRFAGFGIEHVTGQIDVQFTVFHGKPLIFSKYPRFWRNPLWPL